MLEFKFICTDNMIDEKKFLSNQKRELLEELPDLHLDSNWKDLKKELKDDPRYTKFSSSDKKCEREFREYLKDKLVAAKADFRELLKVSSK